ncbi:odorant receptor 49a-like [Vespula maculifrons]|uniref:Odorant receptor 49a-like n=1 Tax=Vespula maculifrons TaxID=7453 RepID=A0ABD2BFZ7_VESMC
MAPLSAVSVCIVKYFTVRLNTEKIKQLLDHLIHNWKLCRTKEELEIMHKFGKETKLFTLCYTMYIYVCMTMFLLLPIFPLVMDIVVPLNESRPLKPIFKGEYFIDEDKHFFPVYFHMSISIAISITALITGDALFLMFNSHICGIFAAVGCRLENFLKDQIDSKYSINNISKDKCLENVRYSIRNHKSALKFAELIESFYSVSLLLQAGLSLICMSISLFEMLIVVENRAEAFRYFNFAVAQLLHLFCMCYPGQRMIDYSTDIRIKAYNGLWYEAPLSIHKLLILVIRKSLEPSYLTAGKIFIFCLETFATILQTATSYFMVISSVH